MEEIVFIVFYSPDKESPKEKGVYGVFRGKHDAMRHAKQIDGYVLHFELDWHTTPKG
jgi:hypothetical protein